MAEISQSTSGRSVPKHRMRRRSAIRIDMTPMVDLAFLLLTFFVLTTSLNKAYMMDLAMPSDSTENPTPVAAKRVVTFIMDDHDKLYWYQGLLEPMLHVTNYSSGGLRKVLQDKKDQIPALVILVKATDHSHYNNIVDMLDELAIADVTQYSMADLSPEDEAMIREFDRPAPNTTH